MNFTKKIVSLCVLALACFSFAGSFGSISFADGKISYDGMTFKDINIAHGSGNMIIIPNKYIENITIEKDEKVGDLIVIQGKARKTQINTSNIKLIDYYGEKLFIYQ